jgi:hypothetical protein
VRTWKDDLKEMLSFPNSQYLNVKIFRWDFAYSWDVFIVEQTLLTEYDSEGYLCVKYNNVLRPVRRQNWWLFYHTPFIFKGERVESPYGYFVYDNLFKDIVGKA